MLAAAIHEDAASRRGGHEDVTQSETARPVDVRARNLHIRLAESADEIKASQGLRYRVFCEEMTAKPSEEMAALEREFDSFDEFCDHLLVLDETRNGAQAVVGTYRMMRREAADRFGRFYTAGEYDISNLVAHGGELLEVGRSCVDAGYRTGATMHLLWRGIAAYVFHYDIDILFGCASLPGIEPRALAVPLAFMHHYRMAPAHLRPRALPELYVDMDFMPPDQIDEKAALQALPPLVKGYLRLGGFVGDGAVVDGEFGTTDVCVLVKTDRVTEKYYRHYAREESRA